MAVKIDSVMILQQNFKVLIFIQVLLWVPFLPHINRTIFKQFLKIVSSNVFHHLHHLFYLLFDFCFTLFLNYGFKLINDIIFWARMRFDIKHEHVDRMVKTFSIEKVGYWRAILLCSVFLRDQDAPQTILMVVIVRFWILHVVVGGTIINLLCFYQSFWE